MIGLGLLLSRGRSAGERALYMLNLPSWNIGAFALPFLQSFLGEQAVMAACLFDVGNSIMCTGGSYAPVSYTHLDVYKRQGEDPALCMALCNGGWLMSENRRKEAVYQCKNGCKIYGYVL